MIKKTICLILAISFLTTFSIFSVHAENTDESISDESQTNESTDENEIPEGTGILEILTCTEGRTSRNVGRYNYTKDIDEVIELIPNIGYHVYGVEINGEFKALEGNTTIIPIRVGEIVSVRPIFRGNVSFIVQQTEGGKVTPEGNVYVGTGNYIDITAVPDPGYICTGIFVNHIECQYTKEGNLYKASYKAEREAEFPVYARFELKKPHTATLTQNEGGSVLPFNENGTTSILSGDTAQFQILPHEGYGIKSVKINGKDVAWMSDGVVYYPNVISDLSVNVEFAPMESIPVSITIEGNGTVTPATRAYINSTFILEFFSEDGYELASVFINGSRYAVKNNKIQLSITEGMKEIEELKIDVSFKTIAKKHKIRAIVQQNIGGSITAEGFIIDKMLTQVRDGDSIVLKFTPDMNYVIQNVTIDGIEVQLDENNTYTISNVNSDHNVIATFIPDPNSSDFHTISVTSGKGGTISPASLQYIKPGQSITFTFVADDGYFLDYIIVDGAKIKIEGDSYSFEGVISNHSIEAVFKKLNSSDIDWDENVIVIDITQNAIISTEILENIKAEGNDKTIVFKGNDYFWSVPSSQLNTTESIDLSIFVGSDNTSSELLEKLEKKMVDKGIQGLYSQIVKTSGTKLPTGATVTVNLGSNAKGKILDYLYYNPNTGTFNSVIEKINEELEFNKYDSIQVSVDNDGKVTLPYNGNEYLILFVYSGSKYDLKVEIEGKGNASFRTPDGSAHQVSIKDIVNIQVAPDPGHMVESIKINGAYINNEFIGSTKAFTLSLGRLDKNTEILIVFKEAKNVNPSDKNDESIIANDVLLEGGIKPWVVAIIVIGIAIIGGIVLFIYKWNEEKDIID